MEVLFQVLCLSVTSHNHLVEVEGDAERPQEVGDKVVVDKDSDSDAQSLIIVYIGLKCNQEGCKPDDNTYTEVHNELNRIGSKPSPGIDSEGNNHTESSHNGEDHQYRHNDVEDGCNTCTRTGRHGVTGTNNNEPRPRPTILSQEIFME